MWFSLVGNSAGLRGESGRRLRGLISGSSEVSAGFNDFDNFGGDHAFPAFISLRDFGEDSAGEDLEAGGVVIFELFDESAVDEMLEEGCEGHWPLSGWRWW